MQGSMSRYQTSYRQNPIKVSVRGSVGTAMSVCSEMINRYETYMIRYIPYQAVWGGIVFHGSKGGIKYKIGDHSLAKVCLIGYLENFTKSYVNSAPLSNEEDTTYTLAEWFIGQDNLARFALCRLKVSFYQMKVTHIQGRHSSTSSLARKILQGLICL